MDHVIVVSLKSSDSPAGAPEVKVFADPSTLPCGPGDTVTWDLGSSEEARELRIEFDQVQALPGGEPLGSEAIHPFIAAPVSEAGRITGTVRSDVAPGRFFGYRFFRGDARLSWVNPASATQDFGGLEIPPPPPRG